MDKRTLRNARTVEDFWELVIHNLRTADHLNELPERMVENTRTQLSHSGSNIYDVVKAYLKI